ncbi:hypothetical protein U1Q18_009401 [Sarracenia purpurea var. burkii]
MGKIGWKHLGINHFFYRVIAQVIRIPSFAPTISKSQVTVWKIGYAVASCQDQIVQSGGEGGGAPEKGNRDGEKKNEKIGRVLRRRTRRAPGC